MAKKRRRPGGSYNAAQPEVRVLADASQVLTPSPMRPAVGRLAPRPSLWTWNPSHHFTELAWPQVVGILRAAEQGNTEQWVDLTERMRADDHVYSVLETRINSVAGASWKLNPGHAEGEEAQEYAQRAADDCERALRGIPNLGRVFRDILDAVPVGWSVLEIIWEPRGDEWLPVELVWLHPRRFRFAEDFSLYLWDDGRAATLAEQRGIPTVSARGCRGMALAPNKYVVHIPRVVQSYPTTSGLLTTCVRAWWEKVWVTKFWLQGAEVAGNPRYWAEVPQAAPDNVFEHLQEGLETLAADGVAAFREGVKVTVQAPLAQGAGGVWQTRYDACNAAISKAVLGSTLNVEIGDTGGAYAAAESQGDITITPRILADADAMWETIARDIFRPYLYFNRHRYGGAVPALPRGETVLFESKIEIDDLLVNTGSVTRNELRQSRGLEPLPPEKGGDEIVRVDAPNAAAGFPFADAPREEAPAALPLRSRPWETAMRIALSTSGAAATPTSTPSPMTPSVSAQ